MYFAFNIKSLVIEKPTPDQYRSAFDYNQTDGWLYWKKELPRSLFDSDGRWRSTMTQFGGKRAGYVNKHIGCVYVNCFGKMRKAHRIIWEMLHGPIPDGMLIDHINMNSADNRAENMRLATKSQNAMNKRKSSSNKSGLKGVCRDGSDRYWVAQIGVDNKSVHLGYFKTKGLAAVAYAKASIKYHGSFARY